MALLQSLRQWLGSAKAGNRTWPPARRLSLEGMEERLALSSSPVSAAGTPVLDGEWFVQSNGMAASISSAGGQLLLTNEYGSQTVGQWTTPTSFQAWGYTAQVVQNGPITEIVWDGNVWSQSAWQNGALGGQWFVQSNGMGATIIQTGGQLILTNEQGTQAVAQWLSPTTFEAWGYTAQVVQNGNVTQIVWAGNVWSQSNWQNGGLTGQWFVPPGGQTGGSSDSKGGGTATSGSGTTTPSSGWQPASISQAGGGLLLTDEAGRQTTGVWLTPTSFQAWGQTAQVTQNGAVTTIQWNGTTWSHSAWQDQGLAGQWFVQSDGHVASISEAGGQLLLTDQQKTPITGQWVSPTSFQAGGHTAQVVPSGNTTQIQWDDGRVWSQSAWQAGGLAGTWFVQSNGQPASISEDGGVLVLTNEQGTQTTGQWVSPTSFQAWGQTAQVVQSGNGTQIEWGGNTWTQPPLQVGGLGGQWVVQSNGLTATIIQTANQLILTNEQGTQTVAQWLSPTSFEAWGYTAQVVQSGSGTTIQWDGNAWTRSA